MAVRVAGATADDQAMYLPQRTQSTERLLGVKLGPNTLLEPSGKISVLKDR